MSKTITLKHTVHSLPRRLEPVYDGMYESFDGLVTLPVDNVNHIRALWFRGYQQTPDGQSLRNFQELDDYRAEVAAQEDAPKTAKSAEKSNDESDDTGRQPASTDGVRESEPKSRKKATKRRSSSSSSSGADDRGAEEDS